MPYPFLGLSFREYVLWISLSNLSSFLLLFIQPLFNYCKIKSTLFAFQCFVSLGMLILSFTSIDGPHIKKGVLETEKKAKNIPGHFGFQFSIRTTYILHLILLSLGRCFMIFVTNALWSQIDTFFSLQNQN